MTMRNYSVIAMTVAGALIAFSPTAEAKTAGSVTVGQEARDTLKEVKGLAVAAEGEADRIGALGLNSSVDSSAHMVPLTELKQDINRMAKELSAVEKEWESLEPWERQAVEKVSPLLQDAATNTQGAISYYNENRLHLWAPEYRDYTEKARHDTEQIADTLKLQLRYEKVRDQEMTLRTTIEGGAN